MIDATPRVRKKQMHIGKNQYQIWGNNIDRYNLSSIEISKDNIEAKWAKQNDLMNKVNGKKSVRLIQ